MGESTKVKQKVEREFSAGGAVFRKFSINNSQFSIKWLVTRSTPSKLFPQEVWRLPKGWLDDVEGGENPGPLASGRIKAEKGDLQKAALKEVQEEGGVDAKIVAKIGTMKFFFNSTRGKVLKFATFYLMEWVKDVAEGFGFETSEVAWLPFEDAYKRLTYKTEKDVLKKAEEILESMR